MLAKSPSATERLIDATIESASACIKERVLLQAVDWRKVDSSRVYSMLDSLAADGVRLPAWLAKALIVSGHVLPSSHQESLDPPLIALNHLNEDHLVNGVGTEAAERWGAYLKAVDDLDAEVIGAGIRRLLALGGEALAAQVALKHWVRAPQLIKEMPEAFAQLLDDLPPARVRLTGFSTTYLLATELVPAMAAAGFHAIVEETPFGQAVAELMSPPADERDALVVMLDLDGLHMPDARLEPAGAQELLLGKLDMLASGLEGYGRGPVLINTLPTAAAPTMGLIDTHHPGGVAHATQLVNGRLAELASRNSHIVLVDGNHALAGIEPRRRIDPKLWFYGRLPFSAEASRHLANGFAGAFRILKRGTAKVLALDLDNTLWGGIFGEDGVSRLLCDDEFPGNAFKAFQRECLRLKSQGFLLVLLSKNNPEAIGAFADHPGMLLREDDFVATRINWQPKPDNIRSMAEELNLGLDSFVFIDDSPHEREAMRRMCPELTVPELPDDPAARPLWLRSLAVTWPVRVTEEDLRRSDMYLAEKRRTVVREKAVSFEDYLRGLEQTLVVEPTSSAEVGRVGQMHMRTNQFNLTTERYDEAAIKAMVDDPERHVVLHGRVLDKFGDHGIVICATARIDGDRASILSFLMSCRVVGRGVEASFLGELLGRLVEKGVRHVVAAYIPTKKNALVKGFYKEAGLSLARAEGDSEVWCWEADRHRRPQVDFITVKWDS